MAFNSLYYISKNHVKQLLIHINMVTLDVRANISTDRQRAAHKSQLGKTPSLCVSSPPDNVLIKALKYRFLTDTNCTRCTCIVKFEVPDSPHLDGSLPPAIPNPSMKNVSSSNADTLSSAASSLIPMIDYIVQTGQPTQISINQDICRVYNITTKQHHTWA